MPITEEKLFTEECLKAIFEKEGFKVRHREEHAPKPADSVSYDDLGLSQESLNFLKEKKDLNTLWRHQYNAIKAAKHGKNVCVSTSTSSGKTEIFLVSAIEAVNANPQAKILAIYPMKALNRQQQSRWENTGLQVGRIDGEVKNFNERRDILRNKQVVVMTPDVVHAFLLAHINDTVEVKDFIKNISMIVVDEVHLYKGMFGTNAAYMFRRLNNIRRLLRKDKSFAQYITASATLPNPCEHSENITGAKDFEDINIEQDGSPEQQKVFFYVERDISIVTRGAVPTLLKSVSNLAYDIAEYDDTKSITFLESRQKTGQNVDKDNGERGIYPYRAGYEDRERDIILNHLQEGDFKGVISTSALEIGIDIDGLNVAIIADMPHDINSYNQRIGRVGRYGCGKSYVIVVKDETFKGELLFNSFNFDINKVLPQYEPALHLEDISFQCIHAACHVGDFKSAECSEIKRFDGEGYFPDSFVTLCSDIIARQTPQEYEEETKSIPDNAIIQLTCSLRYFGKQYRITPGRDQEKYIPQSESLSRENLAREAYPGAVRRTQKEKKSKIHTIAERIFNIDGSEVYARLEYSHFFTTPNRRTFLLPNFKEHSVHATLECGDACVMNLNVWEIISIYGYYERIGQGERIYYRYDEDNSYQKNKFQLKQKTNGTLIFHPALNKPGVNRVEIAQLLFETFLLLNAFDPQDINHISNRLYMDYADKALRNGNKFIALYDICDRNNITMHLVENEGKLLVDVFQYLKSHKDVIVSNIFGDISPETSGAIDALCETFTSNEVKSDQIQVNGDRRFADGSIALFLERDENADDEDNVRKIPCIIAGITQGSDPIAYNILLGGTDFRMNVGAEELEQTEKSTFNNKCYGSRNHK